MSYVGGEAQPALTLAQVYQLAIKHGFKPGQEAATAAAISMGESSGIPNNFNPKDAHGGSVGLMQINGANAHLIGGDNWMNVGTDPDASMAAAHALYAQSGFQPWGAYTDGGYKPYINQAMAIAGASPSQGTSLTSHAFTPPHTLTPTTAGGPYTAEAIAAANPPPPAGAAPTDSTPKTPMDWISKGLKRPPDTVDKDGNPVKGKSPLEKIASSFDKQPGEAAPEAPRPAQFAPAQDPMAQMAGPAAQLFSQIQTAAAKPLSWSTQPYGYNAGPQIPGTTLTSAGY